MRRPEIDILRTAAILMMIVYHTAYDLAALYQWDINLMQGWWLLLQRMTAGLFLLLVGVSAAVSYGKSYTWHKQLHRFLRIGLAALIVSTATYAIDPQTYVRFGILHLIATSVILLPLFKHLRTWAIVPGILCISLGVQMQSAISKYPILLPLGIRYTGFQSIDYFPVIPWFGVILIGHGIGYWIYERKRRDTSDEIQDAKKSHTRSVEIATFPGRHALIIYLIHQPIILGMLWLTLGDR